MRISKVFEKKKPVLSFEIFPPKKAAALENIDATLAKLCELNPDFISVTFGAGGSTVDNRTVDLARKIKDGYGIEPLVHLTCLNYGRSEIESILAQMRAAGLYNILALRGDANPDMVPKDDFKYASDLVAFIKSRSEFSQGDDFSQGDFSQGDVFSVSGACYPEKHLEAADAVSDIHNLKKKVEAGAEHLVSQLFFDNDVYYDFYEKTRIAGITVPIEAGIMPVTNKAQVERMVTMCGATLPVKFRKILDKYGDKPEALFDAGMAYAVNQIVDLIASGVDGIHVYTMNNTVVAGRICEGIRNLIRA